jgi:hypothetical protein
MARLDDYALREQREGPHVKASRKLSRGSFVLRVAGDARVGGKGKGGSAIPGDHDLGHSPGGSGADPDSGPPAGPAGRPA